MGRVRQRSRDAMRRDARRVSRLTLAMLAGIGLSGCVALEGNANPSTGSSRPASAAVQPQGDFRQFVESVWPDARARGVSRATFDAAFAGVTPDPSVAAVTRRQSEFVQPIWTYLNNAASTQRISQGRDASARWKDTLDAVERRHGVPRSVVLGVWGMETNYGGFTGDKGVIRSLATLAHMGYRGSFFREELVNALVILEQRHVSAEAMKGSWAGAMGQTQFMPSSFLKYAVDQNADGRRDIWGSVPDALASTANYLKAHGWQPGLPWGMEVVLPARFDHGLRRGTFARFAQAGVKRADGRALPANGEGRLFYPAGASGPVFLLTANFDVIKTYNMSDAYALGVGHLADRVAGGGALVGRWPSGETQLGKAEIEDLQRRMAALGYDIGEPDGRIGTKTRENVAAFQAKNGMVPDGWPTPAVLARLRSGAR